MQSRRTFLAGSLLAYAGTRPLRGAARSYAEIEKLLARDDIKGKLSKSELPTPALIVDLDAFEHNVARMAAHAKASGRALRPHAKTHKCPEIAKALIKAGAVGACAAKISEAEALARDGVTGLLVTTAVIGPHKIERAVRLTSRRPETILCVDNAQNVRDLNDAAGAARQKLNLAVDLWISNRTGIRPGEPALALAQLIDSLPHVKLAGIQAYAGNASHTKGFEQRKKFSREVMSQAVDTRSLFEKHGIQCPLLTGGSTGTYNIDSEIDGITELQPGSFIFMDIDYNRIGGKDGDVYQDFRNSLFVTATVVSKPTDSSAIVDAGLKAFATDRGYGPSLRKGEGTPYAFAGDEHGRLSLADSGSSVNVGDRLDFVVPHCDPTVNLYDRIYGVRGDAVECAWRIAARGMSQ